MRCSRSPALSLWRTSVALQLAAMPGDPLEILFEGTRESGDELELLLCSITDLSWDFESMPVRTFH